MQKLSENSFWMGQKMFVRYDYLTKSGKYFHFLEINSIFVHLY